MAKLQPFRGYRPASGLEEKIASPPYDVMNSQEARKMVRGNPHSFLHVVKPEVDLPEDIDLYSDAVYNKARDNFQAMIDQGYLIREEKPALYLYRQIMGTHSQIGIVTGASVGEYEENHIKKHG